MTFKRIAVIVAMTTGDFPKIIITQDGKEDNASGACVIPIPRATARPTMDVVRNVIFCWVISLIPVMAMEANTEIVAPPKTHCGMVVRRPENFGIMPAIIKIDGCQSKDTPVDDFCCCNDTYILAVSSGRKSTKEGA